MTQLSIVLPVHNEATIIEKAYRDIVGMLKTLGISFEIVLVENGSTDNSLSVIKRFTKENNFTRVAVAPIGYGSAVLKGLSLSHGTFVCYMPSDGQIDLSVFPALWKLAKSGTYDMVKVKRVTRENPGRTLISFLFSALVSLFFGIPAIDINGSPRIFPRGKLELLKLTYTDSFIDTEFAVKAHILGWKIQEVPMRTLPRIGGTSTRSWKTFAEFIGNLWYYRTGAKLKQWQRAVGII